jgi:phospholipid/cholesterol/gamma-HCH transport system ATP-binding protein
MEPIIQLRGVSKAFGKNVILDGMDLDIYPGEGLGIIGPSGTGKSTILRIIAGLLAPDEGEVYLRGELRRGTIEDGNDPIYIGMVFQQAALFDSLTVEENVGFRLFQQSKISRKHIRELVEARLGLVGMAGVADRYPAQLSGGMRKRVSFARAIMSNPERPEDNPEVLLYDEPTAGLDPIASTVIEDLVRDLQHVEGGCSTYVTKIVPSAARPIELSFSTKVKCNGMGRLRKSMPLIIPWCANFLVLAPTAQYM